MMKIDEARAAQEEAVEMAVEDMVFVAESMWEAGADGIDFDTAGAAGDADLLAALRATETLRARHPDMGIMIGMASEMVLGMHGELEYKGTRLAGLKPKGQLQAVQEAGATIYGPAINTNTGKTVAWNSARALTYVEAVHGRGPDPRAPQRRHGRRRRADVRFRAGRRRLEVLEACGRHPAARRLVGRLG